jgi:Major Facilitator Superfamily
LNRIFENILRRLICVGDLQITTSDGATRSFGDRSGTPAAIRFKSRSAEHKVFFDPELRFGEAYVNGNLGRENTMFFVFLLEGVGIWALYVYGQNPLGFVLLSGLVFFAWGEIYSLFPTTCTDCFGVKYATTNAGLLYTAKGTASLLVPLTNMLVAETGGWKGAFIIAALFNVIAALLAIFVLKPMRQRLVTRPERRATWVRRGEADLNIFFWRILHLTHRQICETMRLLISGSKVRVLVRPPIISTT